MGNLGSGRGSYGGRALVEETHRVDVLALHRRGQLRAGPRYTLHWRRSDGARVASVTIKVSESAIDLDYGSGAAQARCLAPLEWSPCNYGGRRPWFRCPVAGCARRCGALYIAGSLVACRLCVGLAYGSQREDRAGRMMRRRHNICRRLGASPGPALYLAPPPRMHGRTAHRLRLAALAAEQAYFALRLPMLTRYNGRHST